jgi:Ca2+-binding EF-hand superfamily protein
MSAVVEQAELEALYEQFKVLAASEYEDAKFGIHGAISRDTFDKCFIPNTHLHPPAPNLIYDRMFNFYDSKGDGLVDFEEFAIGVSFTHNKSKTPEKLKRIFKGYDLDNDGYVERKDFLRMFKAFYALSKVLVRDIVASLGDELYEQGHMDQALNGRQPISAVFTSSIPPAQRPWTKPTGEVEDDDDDDDDEGNNPVVLPSSKDHMDPDDVLSGRYIRSSTPENATDPEGEKQVEDARRFKFWRFHEDDNEDLAIPSEENDVGSEVLFHMALRGINELLDLLFAAKERAAVEAKFAAEKTEVNEEGEKNETSATVPEEIKYRGGEGKLNYEEFEKIMTGKNAEKLDFVSTWTDLASF